MAKRHCRNIQHVVVVVITSCICSTSAFGIHDPHLVSSSLDQFSQLISSATLAQSDASQVNLLALYQHALADNPLPTKMLTGGTLAVMGDAIAQSNTEEKYDTRRAVSFMGFDMCYRALQHASFPIIVQQCHGQYIGGIVDSIPPIATLASQSSEITNYFAAMEQTLASQLGIVPFLYYPVFYTLTAFVQGSTTQEAVQRAKDTFIPLMKRNLLFWIPVQFIQFGFVDENLQIPFLCACGLAWTFILSTMAGNAKQDSENATEHTYCVQGNEDECVIDPDELFPAPEVRMQKDMEDILLSTVVEEQKSTVMESPKESVERVSTR